VARRYGASYQRGAGNGGSYLLDHTRQAILYGPKGEPIALLPTDEGAKAVAQALDTWVQ